MPTPRDPHDASPAVAGPPPGRRSPYTDEVGVDHVGRRVTVRRQVDDDDHPLTDVVGDLVAADDATFTIRRRSGEVVVVPRPRVVASKLLPPPPPPRRPRSA